MKLKYIIPSLLLSLLVITAVILLSKGKSSNKEIATTTTTDVIVSIPPFKSLVDRITNNSLKVEVLVPAGSSPETFEPTPRQIISISSAKLLFTSGLLGFEQELVARMSANNSLSVVSLSQGIDLIEGDCDHKHHEIRGTQAHKHGVDPHIWSSPRQLKKMATTTYNAISALYKDSLHYETNYKALLADIDSLDTMVSQLTQTSDMKFFLIYHPALTYYSRDYGFEQVAIEDEGKEPSVEQLRKIINRAKKEGVRKIFIQPGFNTTVVTSVIKELGAEVVEINPLAEDVIGNTLEITKQITQR